MKTGKHIQFESPPIFKMRWSSDQNQVWNHARMGPGPPPFTGPVFMHVSWLILGTIEDMYQQGGSCFADFRFAGGIRLDSFSFVRGLLELQCFIAQRVFGHLLPMRAT